MNGNCRAASKVAKQPVARASDLWLDAICVPVRLAGELPKDAILLDRPRNKVAAAYRDLRTGLPLVEHLHSKIMDLA